MTNTNINLNISQETLKKVYTLAENHTLMNQERVRVKKTL